MSIVERYVASPRHRPPDRLEIILGLRPAFREQPFAKLDALYMHILSKLEDPEQTLLIIGMLLIRGHDPHNYISTISSIEHFLGLDAGEVPSLLADMTSLLSWDEGEKQAIRIFHGSFGDFLFDASRSGHFSVDPRAVHTTIAFHCIRHLKLRSHDPGSEGIYYLDIAPQIADGPLSDWLYQNGYIIHNTSYHLSYSNSTPELISSLSELSLEYVLEDMSLYVLLHPHRSKETPFCFWNVFLVGLMPVLQRFVSLPTSPHLPTTDTIQGLHELQNGLYDQIIVKEPDLYYAKQPALPFLLCLKCNIFCNEKARTLKSVPQLLSWNMVSHQHQVKRLGRLDLIDELMPQKSVDILRKFLYDTSRAGRYAVCGDMYADASLACLGYLLCSRLGAPVHLHHTRRILSRRRRNSPWKWRTLLKRLYANTPVRDLDALPHCVVGPVE